MNQTTLSCCNDVADVLPTDMYLHIKLGASDEVAIPPDDSVEIRHTFALADTLPGIITVLPDGWNAQDAAAHLEKRSWLLIRDDGPLSIRRAVSCTLWVLKLKNGLSWSPARSNSVLG